MKILRCGSCDCFPEGQQGEYRRCRCININVSGDFPACKLWRNQAASEVVAAVFLTVAILCPASIAVAFLIK